MKDVVKKWGGELPMEAKFLFLGIFAALMGANLLENQYHDFLESTHLHYIVNDVFMTLFFLVVAIEIRLDFLPGGGFNPIRKAFVPLAGTVGGVVMPATLFLVGALVLRESITGWPIATATDIAVSVVVLQTIFVKHHPAELFLKVLAIADDIIGIIIIAVAFPDGPLESKLWLLLPGAAVIATYILHRWSSIRNWYWYLPFAIVSWVGFHEAHVHPALALVALAFVAPHPLTDTDKFDDFELSRHGNGHDALSQIIQLSRVPMPIILFLFAFANVGIVIGKDAFAALTVIVLGALVIGKPLGITLFTLAWMRISKDSLPAGMTVKHLVVVGATAGVGLTVALFVTGIAYVPGSAEHSTASMGALLSVLVAGFIARSFAVFWKLPRSHRVKPVQAESSPQSIS